MVRVKYIVRIILFLLTGIAIIYLSKKSDDNVESVVEFKYKMIEKLSRDSLDSRHKLDVLIDDTTHFVDESSRVQDGIRYLAGLLGVFVVFEFVFLVIEKKRL